MDSGRTPPDSRRSTRFDNISGCPPGTASESLDYDDDGNLTGDGKYAYIWDAENRLAVIGPAGTPVVNDKRLYFTYDYKGRRVQKVYEIYNGNTWCRRAGKVDRVWAGETGPL